MTSNIGKTDLDVSERFAVDRAAIEAYGREFHVPAAGERFIAAQTTIKDLNPKPTALTLLLQLHQKTTWAAVCPPAHFFQQHLFSYRFAPSMGYSEKQEADMHKIKAIAESFVAKLSAQEMQEVHEEATILTSMLESGVKEPNDLIDFVLSKMREFVAA